MTTPVAAPAIPPQIAQELTEFESLVQSALSPDNDIRKQAESIFTRGRTNSPDKFISFLTLLMVHSQHLDVRQFSGVMLRQSFERHNMADAISAQTINSVKSSLQHLFTHETSAIMRSKVGDVIAILASHTKWNTLLPFIFQLHQASAHPTHRISVLSLLDKLAEYCEISSLMPHINNIKTVLISGLQDNSSDATIRMTALRSTISLLISLEDDQRTNMQDLIPLMFQALGHAYTTQDDDVIRDAIEVMIKLVELQATFLRPHVKNIIAVMLQIAQFPELEQSTRCMAMEFLVTLAATGKGMVRKLNEYVKSVIPLAYTFMLEADHSESEWGRIETFHSGMSNTTRDDSDDTDVDQQYKVGLESIERLSVALGGKLFISVAKPIIGEWIQHTSWKHRNAAIMSICKMSEGCESYFSDNEKELGEFINLIVPYITKDSHVRVRWAAIHALAQLASDYQPTVQTQYHQICLPALMESCQLNNHPALVRHAAICVVDFCREGMDIETLAPYMDRLMSIMLLLLTKTNSISIQSAALAAVTAVASVADDKFIPYYDAFFPGVKSILINARDDEQREFRGKAMECISMMAEAVGIEKFAPEATSIMEILVQTQKELKSDDPQYMDLVQASCRICRCMGDKFVPFLPYVIPPLLVSAGMQDACSVQDDDDEPSEDAEGFQTVTFNVRGIGNKRVSLNTAMLEEKAIATKMLYQYATTLKEYYYPYVEQTATVLIPAMRYLFHEDVRIAAVAIMPALLTSAVHALKLPPEPNVAGVTNGQAPPDADKKSLAIIKAMWDRMYKEFVECITKEPHLENLIGIMDALGDCLAVLPLQLSGQQLQRLHVALAETIKEICERVHEREQRRNSPDFDEQESETIDQENLQEDELLGNIYIVVMRCVKLHRVAYIKSFNELLYPVCFPMLNPKNSASLRTFALCCISQVINDVPGHPITLRYIDKFYPLCLQYAADPVMDVRQSAVFGIGACACTAGAAFKPAVSTAMAGLLKVITAKDSREEANAPATDNAISAVGKIIKYVGPALAGAKGMEDMNLIAPKWLTWLPCSADTEESQQIHQMLVDFVEAQTPCIMGPQNNNIPGIIHIYAHLLQQDEICLESTQQQIIRQLTAIFTALPEQAKNQILSHLNHEQRTKLHTALPTLVAAP